MEKYKYLSIFLNDKLDKGDDYMAAGSKLWQALIEKYEVAEEIVRPSRTLKKSYYYDSELISTEVMFIDHKELDCIL